MRRAITTSDQAAVNVFNVLKTGNLEALTAMTGGIYISSRPVDDDKESVVVSTLAMTGSQEQNAIINVNIFVKNVAIPISSTKTDTTRANRARLNAIANKAIEILESKTNSSFTLTLNEPATLFRDPADGNHFMNIRLSYHSARLDII